MTAIKSVMSHHLTILQMPVSGVLMASFRRIDGNIEAMIGVRALNLVMNSIVY